MYLIKDPKKSKPYQYWEILWFFVLIIDFALIPYTMTTCTREVLEVTYLIEVAIDLLWILHIFVSFTTAFYRDSELVTEFNQIAPKYMKENFVIDLLTTFPTLWTWY
jgi:hypothetical protein